MEYVKKTRFGYHVVNNGEDNPEATHIILQRDVYHRIQNSIRRLQQKAFEAEAREEVLKNEIKEKEITDNKEYIREMNHMMEEAENRVLSVQRQEEEKYEELLQKYKDLQDLHQKFLSSNKDLSEKLDHYKSMNENLIRVCRERANSDRSVEKKKKHPGYLVLNSSQLLERIHNSKTSVYSDTQTLAWKTIMQTPYSTSLQFDTVQEIILQDLIEIIFPMVGIDTIQDPCDNGIYTIWNEGTDDKPILLNGVYKWLYQTDVRAGYWNIILFHTRAVTIPQVLMVTKPQEEEMGKK